MTSDCVVGQWTFVSRLPIMKKINYLGESTLVPLELKSTINLPNTGFPMKANLPQNEPKIMARWEQMRIYERIREVRKGAPVYVLHDGPPYANGPIHLGTAMNKCLKDFIFKSKSMSGFNSPMFQDGTVTAYRLRSKSTNSWAGKSCRCGRSMCARNAASTPRNMSIYSVSSSNASAFSDAGTSHIPQ